MKYQDLFSLKKLKTKYFKMSSAAVVIGALRVKLFLPNIQSDMCEQTTQPQTEVQPACTFEQFHQDLSILPQAPNSVIT